MRAAALVVGVMCLGAARLSAQGAAASREACDELDPAIQRREWSAAIDLSARCEAFARSAPAGDLLARALYARGVAAASLGSPLSAVAPLGDAADLAGRHGLPALAADALYHLAFAYSNLGDWPAYVETANRSYEINPKKDDRARLRLIEARAWTAMELRDRDRSLQEFAAAIALADRIGDAKLQAWILSESGLARWRLDRDRDGALADYERALALARSINDTARIRNVLNNSGNVYKQFADWPEAEHRYAEGLALARREGVTDAALLKNLGSVYRQAGRPAEAEPLLNQAVAWADAHGVARIKWQARQELGTLFRESDPDRAERYFDECLDALEAQHSNLLLEDFSAGALAGAITINDDPYDLYIDHLLRRGKHAEAWTVAERARARAFLDTLSGNRAALAAVVDDGYLDRERKLLASLSRHQSALRVSGTDRPDILAAIARDEDELARLRVKLAVDHPAVAHARYPRLVDSKGMQTQVLGADDVLLEYFLGAEASSLWVITRDSLKTYRLAARPSIETAVREYLAVMKSAAADYEGPAARATSAVLPAGALSDGKRRVIIAAHGILNYLPFETLRLDNGQFLVESRVVSYTASAATLAFLQSRPAGSATHVVAIGDPAMPAAGTDTIRMSTAHLNLLKPLAHAGEELQGVARTFRDAVVLRGADATESALRDRVRTSPAILHFATHGVIDEDHPNRSGLVLTAAGGDDGLIQPRDIYSLTLPGSLVTLSACSSALGRDVTGEGIVGISRAFFQAGATAVVASLWNVDDQSTASLMRHFYASLGQGASIADALRGARLSLWRDDARFRHPYYWGAFVVSGVGSRTVRAAAPRDTTAAALALAGVIGVLLIAVAYRSGVGVR